MMNMNDLTPAQKAGQRLIVGFDGLDLNADLKYLIDTLKIGGIILFKRNISTPAQVETLCRGVQKYAEISNQPPLFIAIDQEGGKVARLSPPFTQFPGNPHMKDEADAKNFAHITAMELNQIGINMNFAPVLDVAPKGMDSIMEERAFGDDPAWVSRLGSMVIRTLQAANIMAVVKHFPGIGRTTLDSHMERPIFHADLQDMQAFDLIPFEAAFKDKAAGIMLSHILYDRIDPVWPASLSIKIAKDLLRSRMGYNGIVMTDDLDMGAIKKYYDFKAVIRQILSADIDMAMICHKGPDIESAFQLIQESMADPLFIQSGEASLRRILTAKKCYLGYGR
jgi:beta-N-acetylhexosaminidase